MSQTSGLTSASGQKHFPDPSGKDEESDQPEQKKPRRTLATTLALTAGALNGVSVPHMLWVFGQMPREDLQAAFKALPSGTQRQYLSKLWNQQAMGGPEDSRTDTKQPSEDVHLKEVLSLIGEDINNETFLDAVRDSTELCQALSRAGEARLITINVCIFVYTRLRRFRSVCSPKLARDIVSTSKDALTKAIEDHYNGGSKDGEPSTGNGGLSFHDLLVCAARFNMCQLKDIPGWKAALTDKDLRIRMVAANPRAYAQCMDKEVRDLALTKAALKGDRTEELTQSQLQYVWRHVPAELKTHPELKELAPTDR